MPVTGYLGLMTTQVMCREFIKCYDDVNICLWTNGSWLNQSAAESACKQRNSSLARITNSDIQYKLAREQFRGIAWDALMENGFWIDVKAVGINHFHWIQGSSLTG